MYLHTKNIKMVRQKGFEPLARGLEGHCSILLSYRHILLERVKGIEPSQPAWKAGALPLSYTRIKWWKRLDLNQCRRRQRIYSPPPLTPRALFLIILFVELAIGIEPTTC